MRNRAVRPIVAILSILILTGVPAQAAPVVLRDVIQVLSNHRNPPELRIRNVSQTPNTAISSRIDLRQGGDNADGQFAPPTSGFSFSATDTGDQDPQKVEVVVLGDVEATICDCGDITIPVGGFPRWPLAFLGVIPFFFLPKGDEVPPFIPPIIPPTSSQPTPTPPTPTPEPATLLLFASGLAAFGAGMRRRFRRSKAVTQIQTTEED
jgi:PEP-CTERM motif